MKTLTKYVILGSLILAPIAYAWGYWYESQSIAMSRIPLTTVQLCDTQGCYMVDTDPNYQQNYK